MIRRLGEHEEGAAAIEFAIVAPLFVVALLGGIDLGLAEYDHMQLDHVVRGAAQVAQADPGVTIVGAAAQRLSEAYFPSTSLPTVDVRLFCACPEAMDTALGSCDTTCVAANGNVNAPYIFYTVSGRRAVKLMFLSSFTLQSSAKVQIR
jgi:Flp pilus assembly protein TadG